MPESDPSTNGSNGRSTDGRFVKGHKGGPGNPMAAKVAKLRAAMFEAVTEADIRAAIKKLKDMAHGGDIAAIKELLLRTLGPPVDFDLMERIEQIEMRMEGMNKGVVKSESGESDA